MATPNPKRIPHPTGETPAPMNSPLYQRHREVLRARADGAQAALDKRRIEDNPYHPHTELDLCQHWETMYLKTRRVIRENMLAQSAQNNDFVSIDKDI